MEKKIVRITFPQDEYEVLKYVAEQENRKISEQIRYCVKEQLKKDTISGK